MEHRRLGRSGLEPGIIGMGTWRTLDVPLSSEDEMATRAQVVDEAFSSGVDFYDSSPMYGNAEAVLGRLLGDRRGQVMVATKVWSPSIERGRHQIDQALKYFEGRVDVYQVHNLVEWRAYLPILGRLKESGQVRAIGVTHYAHSAFPEMMRIMESQPIQTIQIPYNAADRLAAREVLPLAEELDIGVIVMSPLGTGDLVRDAPPDREMEPLAEYGIRTWAQALLKWVVSDSRVGMVIPATSRPGRMPENAEAGNPPFLPEEERERVAWLADRLAR